MIKELENMQDAHPDCIKVSNHRIDRFIYELRPLHSTSYRAGRTARQFEVEEINRIFAKKVVEPATTESVTTLMFAPKRTVYNDSAPTAVC